MWLLMQTLHQNECVLENLTEKRNMDEEEISEEELELYKKKVKTMEWLWGPEETRTVLGLLKGNTMKKNLKDKK